VRGFKITTYFPTGEPSGIKNIQKSNWVGLCIAFPRLCFHDARKLPELNKPGVYILKGNQEDSPFPKIYFGEGDPILRRLSSHESKKDWWDYCITLTSKDNTLNKSLIQYLESRLVKIARAGSRCIIDNKNDPDEPSLTEADKDEAEVFLQNFLQCATSIGLEFLITTEKMTENLQDNQVALLSKLVLKSKGLIASGIEIPEGFLVFKGSQADTKESSGLDKIDRIRRAYLVSEGVLKENNGKYEFSKDYLFTSPTLAATAILGAPAPGPLRWKNTDGVCLRDIRPKL
jgi:hypothetical protein